jgi:hypothetical protein
MCTAFPFWLVLPKDKQGWCVSVGTVLKKKDVRATAPPHATAPAPSLRTHRHHVASSARPSRASDLSAEPCAG